MALLWFSLGLLSGTVLFGLVIGVFPRQRSLVIDRWWMENPERWEWLRRHELAEADNGEG